MNKKIKIMVADDYPIVISGMRDFLKDLENVELVGEALNGRELLDLLQKKHADIVLLDARMPVMDGKETLAKILKYHKDTKVIIFSFENDMSVVIDFIKAGAHAYILKDSGAQMYIEVILEVYHKGEYLSSDQARALTTEIRHQTRYDTSAPLPLSPMQAKILIALCEERSVKEMATRFSIAESTVKSHIKTIKKKSGARNLAGLVIYAIRHGLFKVH